GGFTDERRPSGNGLVQYDTEAEDVGARIDLFAPRLLGRHIADGAKYQPWRRIDQSGIRRFDIHAGARFHQFSQAEIQHFYQTILTDHDVFRLDVPVNDTR